ncbi:MotA/TolQ/ExbB proton channel family protein [candidate division WOR-3 bacterium]|nr:MotA/TolQ/ExbB proton channel family protein [candidate division WOR-3 bacterium]
MILGRSILDLFKGSLVMILLLLASIAALALIIERLLYFFRNRFNTTRGLAQLRATLAGSGIAEALNWSRSQKNPLGRMFTVALENLSLGSAELSDLLYSLILEERIRFERLLGGLGTLANVATLLGLLGTVTGLITAFHNIAITGSGGPAVVSGGIAEALITTAFGLFIGIPTLFFYNYLSKKSADLTISLESTGDRLVVMLARMKEKGAGEPVREQPVVALRPPHPAAAEDSGWKF